MNNRGSKLRVFLNTVVKEQRVGGSLCINSIHLRCTLMGLVINCQIKTPSNQINKRLFTNIATCQSPNSIMNPWFLTGLTDGEGCFLISIYRNEKLSTNWRVIPRFVITLDQRDKALLEQIKSYFCAGDFYKSGTCTIQYRVESVKDLQVIIEHFNKYTLQTQKRADYELFKQALALIQNKEHLTKEGLEKIIAIKASMNWGLSDELKANFSDVVPVKRPVVENITEPYPYWLSGFTSAEGCFYVQISKSNTKVGYQVALIFQLTQHLRDEKLMKSLIKYLNCGNVFRRKDSIDFKVVKFYDIIEKIVPFFVEYKINGIKLLDFCEFKQVAELMKNKAHLTEEGLYQIRTIKAEMNKGRKSFQLINKNNV